MLLITTQMMMQLVVLLVAIKSVISKIKSITGKSDDAAEYVATIKEVSPIDNIVDDFFNTVDNGGAANE